MSKYPPRQGSDRYPNRREPFDRERGRDSKFIKKEDDRIYIANWRFHKTETVAGVNPVLLAGERGLIKRLVISKDERRSEIIELAERYPVESVRQVHRLEFDDAEICDGHQNVVCEIKSLPNPDISEVVPQAGRALVILLDGVSDPRNAGAIVRTATAVGVSAVVLPKHTGAGLGPAFYKTSAGMALIQPICRDVNLSQTLDKLVAEGFWSVAATSRTTSSSTKEIQNIFDATEFAFPERCALVLGGEGEGIKEKLTEKCDYRVYLPMAESVESLNVSVASGVLMYLWRMNKADKVL
jgi:23S rRNA (guanosine2251-2'-O)-methyltransferase